VCAFVPIDLLYIIREESDDDDDDESVAEGESNDVKEPSLVQADQSADKVVTSLPLADDKV
jgi:hypothetical protein